MKTIYSEAQNQIGETCWMSGGPWLDAQEEATLIEAIEHCQSCCEAVCDESIDDFDSDDYVPLIEDVQFLETILYELKDDNARPDWQKEIEHLITVSLLKK